MMKLSIIVVNWNVCELLRVCLASVYSETHMPEDEFEIFLVDNASKDDSVAMVRTEFPRVHLVANKDNVGFGRANNQVLERCQGEYVLLLNPDTIVPANAIDTLLHQAMNNPDVAVMGCRLLNLDGSLQRWTGGAFPSVANVARHYLFLDKFLPTRLRPPSLYLEHDHENDVDVDWVSGAVMLLKRDCLQGIIFNEAFFMYGEDMECCHRMKKLGWRVVYTPICSIIHIQGASMKKQEGEILLSSLKGLRSFYIMTRGPRWVWVLDYLTIIGFFMRWNGYSLMKFLRVGNGCAERARSSWKYIEITRKIMNTATTKTLT